MATYPQELAHDAVCQSHTGHMTGLWFLPTRPLRLNTNERMKGVFTFLPKVQLHVSALENSHLQVVHETLESSYTRFNTGCVQWG